MVEKHLQQYFGFTTFKQGQRDVIERILRRQSAGAIFPNKGSWPVYERDFLALLSSRGVEKEIKPELLHEACLLCSEEKPAQCHRRLVAEYFHAQWDSVKIFHI